MTEEPLQDRRWLQAAIDLSRQCPPAERTYSVGAIIVAADGRELARGFSRETDRYVHAEESALTKLLLGAADPTCPAPPSTARWSRAASASRGRRPAPG